MIRIDPYYQLSFPYSAVHQSKWDIDIPDSYPYRISLSYPLLSVIHNERQSIISVRPFPLAGSNLPALRFRALIDVDLTYLPGPDFDTM
jgi:hypothetical protein